MNKLKKKKKKKKNYFQYCTFDTITFIVLTTEIPQNLYINTFVCNYVPTYL